MLGYMTESTERTSTSYNRLLYFLLLFNQDACRLKKCENVIQKISLFWHHTSQKLVKFFFISRFSLLVCSSIFLTLSHFSVFVPSVILSLSVSSLGLTSICFWVSIWLGCFIMSLFVSPFIIFSVFMRRVKSSWQKPNWVLLF